MRVPPKYLGVLLWVAALLAVARPAAAYIDPGTGSMALQALIALMAAAAATAAVCWRGVKNWILRLLHRQPTAGSQQER